MLISYAKIGDKTSFLNTYSGYDSAINGFSKDCGKLAEKLGKPSTDIAGENAFIDSATFECSCYGRKKICNSIRELEKWVMSKTYSDSNGKFYIKDIKVELQLTEIPEDQREIKIISATKPIFFGEIETNCELVKEMFEKKTKNWLVKLA